MDLAGKKVLVTGAGGFIASHLCEELVRKGAKVKAFIRYNSRNDWGKLEELPKDILSHIEVVVGDIQDPFFVDGAVKGSDVVFHLAACIHVAYSYVAPSLFVSTNIGGTLNVLEAVKRHGVSKMVHTSTSENYGTAQYAPIDEKHPLHGQSPYSATKIGADKLAESYYCSFGVPVATIRPFNTFGTRQSLRAVLPTIMGQVVSGAKEIKLGSLGPVRDWTFVKDTVKGFLCIAESDASIGEVINIGMNEGHSVKEALDTIQKIAGTQLPVVFEDERKRPEKSEVYELICNNEKARILTGWHPSYTFEEGLKESLDYFRENIGRYKPNLYNL